MHDGNKYIITPEVVCKALEIYVYTRYTVSISDYAIRAL